MSRRITVPLAVLALVLAPGLLVWAQSKGKPKVRAALPTKWEQGSGDFFQDVFKEGVVGARPDLSKGTPLPVAGAPTTPGGSDTPVAAGGVFAWSQLISPTTIEDEVKSSKKVLDEEVVTPAKFAGNGYKVIRKQFSVLAMMFAIIGEYDGEVRWKADGPAARDVFARSAGNCKVGTIQVFNEAKIRKQELEDLLSGNPLKDRAGDAKATWNTVTDRSPLMQRLEAAQQTKLSPWVANKEEFKDHSEELLHEAQITAVLAEILKKEGMQDGDDNDYRAFCDRLQKAALDIVDAAKRDDYDKARAAVGEINKSCDDCHGSYRA